MSSVRSRQGPPAETPSLPAERSAKVGFFVFAANGNDSEGHLFYGATRYGLFSPGSLSWKTSGGGVFPTPDAYMHYLFSAERLDLRADIFLRRSVPALAEMAEGHDYKHFVLYSALLPKRHQDLLFEAAARYPVPGPGGVERGGQRVRN